VAFNIQGIHKRMVKFQKLQQINFLLTFETAPYFFVYPVFKLHVQTPSERLRRPWNYLALTDILAFLHLKGQGRRSWSQ
jgi:hypothetical protein